MGDHVDGHAEAAKQKLRLRLYIVIGALIVGALLGVFAQFLDLIGHG